MILNLVIKTPAAHPRSDWFVVCIILFSIHFSIKNVIGNAWTGASGFHKGQETWITNNAFSHVQCEYVNWPLKG